jgi:hypothetical protein
MKSGISRDHSLSGMIDRKAAKTALFRIPARSDAKKRILVDFQICVDVSLVVEPLDESQIHQFLPDSVYVFQVQVVLRMDADEVLPKG